MSKNDFISFLEKEKFYYSERDRRWYKIRRAGVINVKFIFAPDDNLLTISIDSDFNSTDTIVEHVDQDNFLETYRGLYD